MGSYQFSSILLVDKPKNGDCTMLPEKITVRIMWVSWNGDAYQLLQFPSISGLQTHHRHKNNYFDACDGVSDFLINDYFLLPIPDTGTPNLERDFDYYDDLDLGTW